MPPVKQTLQALMGAAFPRPQGEYIVRVYVHTFRDIYTHTKTSTQAPGTNPTSQGGPVMDMVHPGLRMCAFEGRLKQRALAKRELIMDLRTHTHSHPH